MAKNIFLDEGILCTEEGPVDIDVRGVLAVNGQPLAELVPADPAEVALILNGDTTEIELLDEIARRDVDRIIGQYYWSTYATSSPAAQTLNRVVFVPNKLTAGTIDRLGVEVSTNVATATGRVGIYVDDGGKPGNLIAEGTTGADTYPLDHSTTGAKTAAIDAEIEVNGIYWLAHVLQTVTGVSLQGGSNTAAQSWTRIPLGTSPPTGTTAFASLGQNGVTLALPDPAVPGLTGGGQDKVRFHFRYSE